MLLTAKGIAATNKPGRYGDGHGLYMQVQVTKAPNGQPTSMRKCWLFRYQRDGRERWMGLGPLHTISLKEARDLALKARQQVINGIDPIEVKREQRAAQLLKKVRSITFEEAARQYFAAHEKKWRNAKHRAHPWNAALKVSGQS